MTINRLESTYLCLRLTQLQIASSKNAVEQAKGLLAKPIYPFDRETAQETQAEPERS